MKRFTFCISAVIGFTALNAQTLTETIHQPQLGDIETVRQLDTAAFSSGLPNNTSGANSLWDFSAAHPLNSSTLTNYYSAPSTFTHGTLFPGSTIVQDLPGNMFTYFKFASTPSAQTEIVGVHRPDIAISFSNTGTVIQYPAALGFSVTDDVAGTYSVGTIVGPATGETKTIADGTGTLVLGPGAVFNNVIRVKSVQTLTLTQGTLSGKLNQTVYNYYSGSQKFPIINVTYISTSIGIGTPTVTAGLFANAQNYSAVGITENNALSVIGVFPNPASDVVYVNSNDIKIKRATVVTITGQEMEAQLVANTINVAALSSGVYFLKLETNSGTIARKIVISH